MGATALACVAGLAVGLQPALAQDLGQANVSRDAEMLLESDTLIFDNDRNIITARGGVQIDYDGNRLVADSVTYDRGTGRLIARGGVEIIDTDGTRIQSEEIDITDDFRDGFVRALRVETADKTYFAADSAERRDGTVTTFNYGVYTACEPCEERPDKPPVWRIRAQKIIWNGEAKTIRFERARFELFGLPIAWLPVFETADPTVKQKSGFLFPRFRNTTELGFGAEIPYYLALSPSHDLTLFGTYFTKQGFLGQAEWRQRLDSGEYSVRLAGIYQQRPELFNPNTVNNVKFRGLVGSRGRFAINPRWTFGWDVVAQTDKYFGRQYGIAGYNNAVQTSQVYLTGLNDRNFFDLRAYRFQVQETQLDTNPAARNPRQPWVLPAFDYSITPDEPIAGGELNIDINLHSVHRSRFDARGFDGQSAALVRGIDGHSTRLTAEAEWKRSFIAPGGLVLTPILHARADAIGVRFGDDAIAGINGMAMTRNVASDIRSAYFRTMATAGMEARWPVLFSASSSTHILEPVGQIFIRPNEPYGTSLGIPNEDAQSLVFDAATLFERDKFSGYDRIEGGIRANLGFRYSGGFDNGWTTNAIFGQSFHLAGRNPFASPDLVNVGAFSGLESNRSDYVGQVGVISPFGLSLTAGGRFDEKTFAMRRADLTAGYTTPNLSIVGRYTFIEAQPDYGFATDREEAQLSGSLRFHEHWRVFGSGTYDLNRNLMVARSIGFAYDDECFDIRLFVTETQSRRGGPLNRNFGFNVALRTIGDFGTSSTALTN